jgi:gentisate 1,2-dioxygenase
MDSATQRSAERSAFYAELRGKSMAPLWEVLRALVTPTPRTPVTPAIWRYSDVRPELMRSASLITAAEAERRVLIMENPALPGQSSITQSLYAGLQVLMPGETARSHRHTQSALRLVIEGECAYTAVDGERRTMRRGDFIITPNWTWHDHGNPGDKPVVWLDGLDIPLVRFLDASFAEHGVNESQTELRQEGDNLARYGSNLVPLDYRPRPQDASRLFVYPWEQTRRSLRGIAGGTPDPHFGHALRFVNPGTGASPMPTIGTRVQLLLEGTCTRPRRSTDGTVYVCLEGFGEAELNGQRLPFGVNDVFVVPSWIPLSLHAASDTVLFAFSDEPVQQALGLWREEKL